MCGIYIIIYISKFMRSLIKMSPQDKCIDSEIDEENHLSKQELKGVADAFEELKDDKKRKKFLQSLEEDNF